MRVLSSSSSRKWCSAVRHFERDNAIEIRAGIIFVSIQASCLMCNMLEEVVHGRSNCCRSIIEP